MIESLSASITESQQSYVLVTSSYRLLKRIDDQSEVLISVFVCRGRTATRSDLWLIILLMGPSTSCTTRTTARRPRYSLSIHSVHTHVHVQYTQSTVLILTCDVFTVSGELHSASSGCEVPERLSEHRHQRGV